MTTKILFIENNNGLIAERSRFHKVELTNNSRNKRRPGFHIEKTLEKFDKLNRQTIRSIR